MNENISGVRRNGARKPANKQALPVKQANKTADNGGAGDRTAEVNLSDRANSVCQMMKITNSIDFANCDTADLAEPTDQGLFEFKGSSNYGSIGPMVFLESLHFHNDLIEEYIANGLKENMIREGANFIAIELGYMINSFTNKNGATIEERAVNREIGTRLAAYFAETFIDNPVEIKVFMDGIADYAKRDTMLEKGYYFWEGQAYEIYKPVPISIFFKQRNTTWSNETVNTFKANEEKVTEAINAAVTALDNDTVIGKLEQILTQYGLIMCSSNRDDVPNDAPWVADGQNRRYA